ncbi:MAG TPA: PH domain-containing protein [Candidatus Paceibacterota bacterium]|nr:PH domain-containing protein [Candidatus Paceibacterota bacterium]HMP18788.1 PH domain-containing protein [Candidatus Paceibacterota bacterium]HMP85458.1 PH domain-containing protein [Candidatus Paceibacterota bacterium]
MIIKLDNDEHVVFEVRKHWFTFTLEITLLAFLAILPFFIIAIIKILPFDFSISATGGNIFYFYIFSYFAWTSILWIFGFLFWTDYYLDTWIITTKKLIDVEQHGLFRREISIIQLDKIQDVKSEIRGIVPTIMNYGDIHVQSAGQQKEFLIHNVPKPDQIRQKLNEALSKYKMAYVIKEQSNNFENMNQNFSEQNNSQANLNQFANTNIDQNENNNQTQNFS